MATVTELAVEVGTSAACQALSMPRASYYRDGRKASAPPVAAWRPSPARTLRPAERRVSTTLRQVLTEFSEFFMCVEPAC